MEIQEGNADPDLYNAPGTENCLAEGRNVSFLQQRL